MNHEHNTQTLSDDSLLVSENDAAVDERRHANRVNTATIRCGLGDVRDLSETGMRIGANAVPKFLKDVELFTMDRAANVRCRVVWTRTLEQFQREIGIEFVNVGRRDAEALRSLARAGIRRTL